jgi:hypothetical protein
MTAGRTRLRIRFSASAEFEFRRPNDCPPNSRMGGTRAALPVLGVMIQGLRHATVGLVRLLRDVAVQWLGSILAAITLKFWK